MPVSIARNFNRAANSYDAAAVVYREVTTRMLARLDYIKMSPARIVDLGANTGFGVRALAKRYPKASVFGIDIAEHMLRYAKRQRGWFSREQYIGANAMHLPFLSQSIDILFSNLVFQWIPNLTVLLQECQRVLKPEGLLFFSTYGPDTLKELRHAWQGVDTFSHVHDFQDMHDVGDALLQAQFLDPVVDMEMLTLRYPSVLSLCRELQAVGARNFTPNRRTGLLGKQQWQRVLTNYEYYRDNGKLPATFEIIYALAWHNSNLARTTQNESIIPVSSITRRK